MDVKPRPRGRPPKKKEKITSKSDLSYTNKNDEPF